MVGESWDVGLWLKELYPGLQANLLALASGVRELSFTPAFSLPSCTPALLQGIIKHLGKVLSRYPPPAPTEAAIRLVEAVGKLQNFVSAGRCRASGQGLCKEQLQVVLGHVPLAVAGWHRLPWPGSANSCLW